MWILMSFSFVISSLGGVVGLKGLPLAPVMAPLRV